MTALLKLKCKYLLLILCILLSCKEDKQPEKKINTDSVFSSLEINGDINKNSSFNIRAEKAFADINNNLFRLENIKFFIAEKPEKPVKQKDKKIYSINSEKGSYDKSKGLFILKNNTVTIPDKNITIVSDIIRFLEKPKDISGNKVQINSDNYKITGTQLKLDSSLKKMTLKKVKVKFN